jgi:acetyl-CoA/propionyl-CoA carboxylase biotin carboxyl carrier protein
MSDRASSSKRPIRRVLIASKSEAAIRVIQACRELGIESIAVYAEEDSRSLCADLADDAYRIGTLDTTGPRDSIDRLIEAARRTGSDAVHPGYGLLAENPAFARAVIANDLIFVGPTPETMSTIGSRTRARSLAVDLGIPVLPDEAAFIHDDGHAVAVAARLSFPITVRSRSAAGGRASEIVRKADDLTTTVDRVRSQGLIYYDDDSVQLERYVSGLRRVDVQVLADLGGNAVILGQRECPFRREEGRLIERAPAQLADSLGARLDAAALTLAKGCGLSGAGTFGFVVRGDEYFFVEATRSLQAAHALSEMVTRIDIVQAQLRVAGGEQLWIRPSDARSCGCALLCQIKDAEPEGDPRHAGGTIGALRLPTGPNLRVDSAAFGGCTLASLQDSLIAQVTAWGPNLDMSRQRMIRALQEFAIEGPSTTIPYLLRVLRNPQVVDGRLPGDRVDVGERRTHLNGRHPGPASQDAGPHSGGNGTARSDGRRFQVSIEGKPYMVEVAEVLPVPRRVDPQSGTRHVAAHEDGVVASPMRGTVVALEVTEGTAVREGTVLCTIEAMKMELEVRAPHDGVVSEIKARPGIGVAAGALLMRVNPAV